MIKSELIEAVADQGKISKTISEIVVNLIFDSMKEALTKGERIEIRGFGNFTVRKYKAFTSRNPKTGEPLKVQRKKLPFFRVGKELFERLNSS